jgi:hypothetical protein
MARQRHQYGCPRLRFGLWAVAVVAIALVAPQTGAGERPVAHLSGEQICDLISVQAEARNIPPGFLARLIWQESRFNRLAISPKGAQGIAQFMPATAAERALVDPFDVPSALAASAAFLGELAHSFGNLGLAAAAYNAGPNRVQRWLDGQAGLPRETRHYVRTITGLSAEDWQQPDVEADFTLDDEKPFDQACAKLVTAGLLAAPTTTLREAAGPVLPWGAQVAAQFSRDVALSAFERLQRQFSAVLGGQEPMVVRHRAPARGRKSLFAVRIGAETRAAAEAFCDDLRAIGGACVVMRN